jgi:hypothetical protein
MIKLLQNSATPFKVTRAGICQRHVASGAVDQMRTQMRFEHGNSPANKRIGDTKCASSAAETFCVRHAHEDTHRLDRIHDIAPNAPALPALSNARSEVRGNHGADTVTPKLDQ